MNLFKLIRSGRVRRWHANPDLSHAGETNGHHQWAVAALILTLHPAPSLALVREALFHDVGEVDAGDLSAPFKDANPVIAGAHAAFEFAARVQICGAADLTADEHDWLKFCDRLAAYLWMLTEAPRVKDHPDWSAAVDWLVDRAVELACADEVGDLILKTARGWE